MTTARIVAVQIVRAGSTLMGDHLTGAATISVAYGWDFEETGGELSIAGTVYTYTGAAFPDDDSDPFVLTLASPLVADALDGDFVAVEPLAEDKIAQCELGDSGEPVYARVSHALADRIAEGPRTATDSESVLLTQEGSAWKVDDVLGKPPVVDPGYLDVTIQLPPQIIPQEGVTQWAQAVIDEAIIDRLQGNVAVLDKLYVARYATGEGNETTPDPDSSVISLSSEDGFTVAVPTGEVDPDGEPLYEITINAPTRAFDEQGNRISAVFRGKVIADDIAVLQGLIMQGDASDGFISRVAPNALLQLDNLVGDPDAGPDVTFGPKTRRWPGLTSNAQEIGWGTHNGFVVSARHNGGDLLQARFTDPDTGLLDHETDILPFHNVAGFTAGGGKLYVLAKFTKASDPWTITRHDPNGIYDGTSVNVNGAVDAAAEAALGFDGGQVLLLDLDGSPSIRRYGVGLNLQSTLSISGLIFPGDAVGVGTNWIAHGSVWNWLSGTGSTRTIDGARSWPSYTGPMTGAGRLPDNSQFAATNQSGTLTLYNDDLAADASLYASWTKMHTPTGRESRQSPVASRQWPARTYATVQTPPTGGGYDDVQVYASGTSGARTSMFLVPGMPVGQTQVTISEAPTGGTNPPATSGFSDGTGTEPGRLASEVIAPDGDPVTLADGNGDFRALRGGAGQCGEVSVSTTLNTNVPHSVTFAVPFMETPVITSLTVTAGADPQQIEPLTVSAKSATGFTFKVQRTGGSGNVTVDWHAQPATQ